MSLKDLFQKRNKKSKELLAEKKIITQVQQKYEDEVNAVENSTGLMMDKELLKIYAEYFAPNNEFYSDVNDPKFKAYFDTINSATVEMLNQPNLFYQATKREHAELVEMYKNRVPGYTNQIICGLIFCVGRFAVVPSSLLCVDFAEYIPNCIAIYLLLIAQKFPEERRKFMIDAGDGTDTSMLITAMEKLKVCDSKWEYKIF